MTDTAESNDTKISAAKSTEPAPDKLKTEALTSTYQTAGQRVELSASDENKIVGAWTGSEYPDQELQVTVMVKSKASDDEVNRTLQEIASHKRKPLTDAEFKSQFGADPGSMARVEKFARDYDLTAEKVNAEAGQLVLKGKIQDIDRAFGLSINEFKTSDGSTAREYFGEISVPKDIAGDVQGVLGLDTRAKLVPQIHLEGPLQPKAAFKGYMPTDVADAYHFPAYTRGLGQSVAIIELGGGYDAQDNAQYYLDHQLVIPQVQAVTVDGAYNDPGFHMDSEVNLDSQIIGTVAPDANQQIIFAPPNTQGFIDAVTRATFPQAGEMQNSVISASWGGRESFWSQQDVQNMDAALKKAALKGISVFVASGDGGATDNSPDGQYQPDFPSSDPLVTACGGTQLLHLSPVQEVAWNDGSDEDGASGGGISNLFTVPDFQKGLPMPPNMNHQGKASGRGSPDVAGDAAQSTGYTIRLHGEEYSAGGTSAVAPLYAALTLRINGALDHPVGDLNPFLYKNATKRLFNQATSGDNNGYKVTAGWNPVTGWGSIKGDQLFHELQIQDKAGT